MMSRLAILALLTMLCSLSSAETMNFDDVLMGSEEIQVSVSDMEALLTEGHAKAQLLTVKDRAMVDKLLRQLYITKHIAEEAKESTIASDPVIQSKLKRLIERFYFAEKIKEIDNQPLPDFTEMVEEEYASNRDDYKLPERVEVTHILIRTKDRYKTVRTPEEAKKLAEELRAKALAGEPFRDLVKKYSEDPTKNKNNGSLGLLERGKLVKSFEEAAFGLKRVGDISEVVETEFGFHVIQLLRRLAEQELNIKDVREKIEAKLKKEFINNRRQSHFNKIIEKNKPKIDDTRVESYLKSKLATLEKENKE